MRPAVQLSAGFHCCSAAPGGSTGGGVAATLTPPRPSRASLSQPPLSVPLLQGGYAAYRYAQPAAAAAAYSDR